MLFILAFHKTTAICCVGYVEIIWLSQNSQKVMFLNFSEINIGDIVYKVNEINDL